MTSEGDKPDIDGALEGLKDFQRETVDYVYHRLYEEDRDRFLIADEVGLGKTLVARGVIARAIDRLWEGEHKINRIDIIYVCSNTDIAQQNINRLRIGRVGRSDTRQRTFASRLTLLPRHLQDLDQNRVNFVSFTPGTSFNLRSSGGIAHERALIYRMLRDGWGFGDADGPMNVFQYSVTTKERWRGHYLERAKNYDWNKDIAQRFMEELEKRPWIQEQFRELTDRFSDYRDKEDIPDEDRSWQSNFLGQIRRLLANTCCRALEPDIVIMDEFQRFKYLLRDDCAAGALAQKLFNYDDAKTILLSATPYKPFTTHQEQETDENHYKDFLNTVDFLFADSPDCRTEDLKRDLRNYREAMFYPGAEALNRMRDAKYRIENSLKRVMVRNERLSASPDRNGMLEEEASFDSPVKPADLRRFATIDSVSEALQAPNPVGYWKSAPYLLNTMDRTGYKLKREFVDAAEENLPDLIEALADREQHLLSWQEIESCRPVDSGNGRLRKLLAHTVEQDMWKLLWIPPNLPYYRPEEGPFADVHGQSISKHLVFSSWRVVPKVIAMLASYEAERRMIGEGGEGYGYADHTRRRARLLEFPVPSGSPSRMANLLPFYPCLTLADLVDPVLLGAEGAARGDGPPDLSEVKDRVRSRVEGKLRPVLEKFGTGGERDESWYWAAEALLDRVHKRAAVRSWFNCSDELAWQEAATASGNNPGQFEQYVELFRSAFSGELELGSPPEDLVDVLTEVALGAPAVCALRSLRRIHSKEEWLEFSEHFFAGAVQISDGFRTLFNLAHNTTFVRNVYGGGETRYWESMLRYCGEGNLQAVLDEYVHILQESLGLVGKPPVETVPQLVDEIGSAVSIRTANMDFDEITVDHWPEGVKLDPHTIRCRFALRFGNSRAQSTYGYEEGKTRKDQVRKAFNSPFWPFILATTSIGKEGLDFHQYCMNICHWNLPGNPVDLEQREGRVHRYKGHVIRNNISVLPTRDGTSALEILSERIEELDDPWEVLFETARSDYKREGYNELVPYWLVPDATHKLIRHVPAYPLSKEQKHFDRLKRAVANYRLVFGQPRQEDLLTCLQSRCGEDLSEDQLHECRIDLSPRGED